MSGEIASDCCCGGTGPSSSGVYYATPCSVTADCISITGCPGPAQIAFCVPYLQSLGITTPLDPAKCYLFTYGCCLYKITSYDSVTQCPGTIPGVVNQGKLARIWTPGPGQDCCDYPINSGPIVAQSCITDLWDVIDPDWKANVSFGLDSSCWMMVANDYQRVDQFGVVKGLEPKIRTTFSECVDNYGIPDYQRCESCDILQPISNGVVVEQSVGLCDKPDTIQSCSGANQWTYSVTNSLPCSECIPCACCGEDPCAGAGDIPFCDDHKNTYTARTYYSLYSPCDYITSTLQKLYVREVMTITFQIDHDCTTINQDVLGISDAESCFNPLLSDPWQGDAVGLKIGNVTCVAYSTSVEDFAKAINSTFAGLVRAELIGSEFDCFWLGNRQTCTFCCEQPTPPGCYEPNALQQKPPWINGDRLAVTGMTIKDNKRVYTISAYSPQYAAYAEQHLFCASPPAMSCDWFALPPIPPLYLQAITVGAVSATGNTQADIQYVSCAEYYCGTRYAMRQMSEPSLLQQICTFADPALTVPLHIGTASFPESEIPLLWLPSGRCAPLTSKWVVYPFIWTPAPCDPETPLPVKCPNDGATEFQDPNAYCQTSASVPQIISPPSP